MPYLPPLHVRELYFADIEAEIQRLFDIIIYAPLARILSAGRPEELLNAETPRRLAALTRAIVNGEIWYDDAQFKGKFTSATTKELRSLGATWNAKGRTFSLAREAVPPQLQIAMAGAKDRADKMQADILAALQRAKPAETVAEDSRTIPEYNESLKRMDADFRKSVRGAVQKITIAPKLTDSMREVIAKEWGENLDLYIVGWADQNILELRQKVSNHVLTGGRAEGMEKMIRENYGVSKRKAKFLARQETSLLLAKFQKSRYGDLGIRRYKWSTSHDERVRPAKGAKAINGDHRILDGKIFSFDDPPITCRRTGARNNPGEDFNCRCVAIPIFD